MTQLIESLTIDNAFSSIAEAFREYASLRDAQHDVALYLAMGQIAGEPGPTLTPKRERAETALANMDARVPAARMAVESRIATGEREAQATWLEAWQGQTTSTWKSRTLLTRAIGTAEATYRAAFEEALDEIEEIGPGHKEGHNVARAVLDDWHAFLLAARRHMDADPLLLSTFAQTTRPQLEELLTAVFMTGKRPESEE